MTTTTSPPRSAPSAAGSGAVAVRRITAALELGTGVLGIAGGLLLALSPDGSLMRADPEVLSGSPFTDWRLPGVLLATLVGAGFLFTGWWQWRAGAGARALSMFAGAGLVLFEAVELAWLGFHPLEAVFAVVGGVVFLLAAGRPAGPDAAGAAR